MSTTVIRKGKVLNKTGPQEDSRFAFGRPSGKGKHAPSTISRSKQPNLGNQSNKSYRSPFAEVYGQRVGMDTKSKAGTYPSSRFGSVEEWTAKVNASRSKIASLATGRGK